MNKSPETLSVAYDVSSLTGRQFSGAGVYTIELYGALRNLGEVQVQPFWRLSRWKYRKNLNFHVNESRPWIGGFGFGAQVVHGPDFRVIDTRRAARVVSVLDLAFVREGMTSPEFGKKKKRDLDRQLLKNPPDAIIAISEATKRDLVSCYPEFESRTHVVYLGGDHLKVSAPSSVISGSNAEPYFLFVGNLEARKNVFRIIEAFEKFSAHAPKAVRLRLIGKPGYRGDEILRSVERSPMRDRIDILGFCSNEELQSYYRNALALVYPSLIEGFGIPVLEAMLLGCPVITSDSTACVEIVGDKAWLVGPEDVDAMVKAMNEVLSLSSERRQELISQAFAQASKFTWEKCARDTVEVYRRALEPHRV